MDATALLDAPAVGTVAPLVHTGTVERTPVRIAASPLAPANAGVLPSLVHDLAVEIAGAPVRPTPAMLRAATARVVAGSTWSHYRAGAQRLASLGSLVAIARAVTDDDTDRIKAALRTHLARNGVSAGEVRLLRHIHAGTVPKVLGNAASVSLGVLANAQLITTDDGATWDLSDDVRYSLLVD
jgi:hypothetical protein